MARRPVFHQAMVRRQREQRLAYTLTELLIVIMIALLLMVISLPVVKTVMDDARPREASRILNTVFFTSKSRSAASGLPAGVEFVLQRMNDPMATQAAFQCTQMYMVEVPSLYSGDTTTSVAMVNQDSPSGGWYELVFQSQIPTASPPAPVLPDTTFATAYWLTDALPLQTGSTNPGAEDVFDIRFDFRGPWFRARRNPSNANQFQVAIVGTPPVSVISSRNGNSYHYAPFQLRRPPVRVGNPVELPRSTAIDMVYSGIGPTSDMRFDPMTGAAPVGMDFANATALRLMFAPEGNVFDVTFSSSNSAQGNPTTTITTGAPTGTVHFLIGLTNKVNSMQDGGAMGPYNAFNVATSNLADGNALWVSVGRSSGIVTTNENAPDSLGVADPTDATLRTQYFQNCRRYATAREQKGGR